ncbi:Hypothetical protein POVR2_LOCUS212 [uncultured virus]|nr:Hypothetical protein POVR2_LOCUS212 [uncultured virus]
MTNRCSTIPSIEVVSGWSDEDKVRLNSDTYYIYDRLMAYEVLLTRLSRDEFLLERTKRVASVRVSNVGPIGCESLASYANLSTQEDAMFQFNVLASQRLGVEIATAEHA